MVTAILHNIRSIHNVGSIFRTADGFAVEKLYLSGYTPEPIDRFGRKRKKFEKVALGAEGVVDWRAVNGGVFQLIDELQTQDVTVLACEPIKEATDISNVSLSGDACLVFGNEVDGLPEEVISMCDRVVKIPMQGKKSSLNISVAFGVITHKLIDSSI
jgi:tRNA G18 (ribose-2'-O)-methylase SpoU